MVFKEIADQSIFQNVFLSKYSEKNFQKSVQPAAPKYFVQKFHRYSEKFGGFKIFRFLSENFSELRFLLIGLSPGLTIFKPELFFQLAIGMWKSYPRLRNLGRLVTSVTR